MIYLDAAVTVPTSADVRDRISRTLDETWGNASGAHQVSRKAKNLLEEAREIFANSLEVSPENLVFTSGATESLNIAIQGFGRANPDATVFYSAIEHPAVVKTANYLFKHGHKAISLGVDSSGILNVDELQGVRQGDLVCVMPVNNEIGVINDIEKIAQIVHDKGGFLLLDCVQSFYVFEPKVLCAIGDFVVFSSHKLGGPQGVGLLVAKDRKVIDPLAFGGSQEWELRPGTQATFLIDAFSYQFEKALSSRAESIERISKCQSVCIDQLLNSIAGAKILAHGEKRSPHIVSVDIGNIEAQMLVAMVDAKGVCVSRGSACASGASTPSPVLLALGMEKSRASSTLRLSFYAETKVSDVRQGVEVIATCVSQLRNRKSVGV